MAGSGIVPEGSESAADGAAPTGPRGSTLLWIGSIVHLLLWAGVFWLLGVRAPKTLDVFQDFGIELPGSVLGLVAASDFVATHWYALVPVCVLLVVGGNYCAWALLKSSTSRALWVVVAAVVPLLLLVWWNMLLIETERGLHDALQPLRGA
jgi:hypothetical protein